MVFLSNLIPDYSHPIAVVLACFILQTLKKPLPGLSSTPAWPVSNLCLAGLTEYRASSHFDNSQSALTYRARLRSGHITSYRFLQALPLIAMSFQVGLPSIRSGRSQLLSNGRACPVLPNKPNTNEGSQICQPPDIREVVNDELQNSIIFFL